jgi:tRNA G18 (ribose-2'-O)-methylase SpoU
LIGFNFHRGILACGRRGAARRLTELVTPGSQRATYVICIDVQDPTNLGGVLRNCAAFGVDGVLLGGHCADAFSRRVLRVSMGTAFRLPISVATGGPAELCRLGDELGIELVASVLEPAAERLEIARRAPRMALLIGNEAHGLAPEWLAVCQRRVTLVMDRGTDSLNVASATAVLLYHFQRVAEAAVPAP